MGRVFLEVLDMFGLYDEDENGKRMKIKDVLKKYKDEENEENVDLPSFVYREGGNKFDDSHDKYPISQYDSLVIACRDNTLKSDFNKRDKRKITYIEFSDLEIDLKEIDNEPFWHVQVTEGDISWIEHRGMEECDGELVDEDLKSLQCLVNAKTGEYKYLKKPIK